MKATLLTVPMTIAVTILPIPRPTKTALLTSADLAALPARFMAAAKDRPDRVIVAPVECRPFVTERSADSMDLLTETDRSAKPAETTFGLSNRLIAELPPVVSAEFCRDALVCVGMNVNSS